MHLTLLIALFLTTVVTSDDSPCKIDNYVQPEDFTLNIDDVSSGEIAVYETENLDKIYIAENNKYLSSKFLDHKFHLSLTNEFKNYEENETKLYFALTLKYECTSHLEKKLMITINIRNTNNHKPIFTKDKYEMILPMPLPRNFMLNNFESFEALDIDISNQKLVFGIEENDFFAFTESTVNATKKKYQSILMTKNFVRLDNDRKFRITVTDEDVAVQDVKELRIKIDESNSILPDPVFSKPLYIARIDENKKFIMNDEIKLDNDKYSVNVDLEGELKDYFQSAYSDGVVRITAIRPFEDEILTKSYTFLVIQANVDSALRTGKSILLIDISQGNEKSTSITSSITPSTSTLPSTSTVSTKSTSTPATPCPPCPITSQTCSPFPTATSVTCNCPECPTCSPYTTESSSPDEGCSYVGWIVAVSVLSVSLVVETIVIVFVYLKYLRPRNNIFLSTLPTTEVPKDVCDGSSTIYDSSVDETLNDGETFEELKTSEKELETIKNVRKESISSDVSDNPETLVKFHPEVTEIEIDA